MITKIKQNNNLVLNAFQLLCTRKRSKGIILPVNKKENISYFRLVFLLGMVSDVKLQKPLFAEAMQHKDIVMFYFGNDLF